MLERGEPGRPRTRAGICDMAGEAVLRHRIDEYLALHLGDRCDPEQIVVTPGGYNAFALAALVLGKRVGVPT